MAIVLPEYRWPVWREEIVRGLREQFLRPQIRELERGLREAQEEIRRIPLLSPTARREALRGALAGFGRALARLGVAATREAQAMYAPRFEAAQRRALAEFGALERARREALEREWRTAERIAEQEWRARQAELERRWRAAQAELERKWRTTERISTQDWQAAQAAMERAWRTRERVGAQQWRSAEAALERKWRTGGRIAAQDWQTIRDAMEEVQGIGRGMIVGRTFIRTGLMF